MNNKLFSVIIATYNAGKTLQRCLDSIICQKSGDVELIIIDGGSTDSTLEIINKYSQYIDYTISEPDRGLYDAWNKGIKQSHGKWIMFIGADDYYAKDIFDKYRIFLSRNDTTDIDLITAKCIIVNEKEKALRQYGQPYKWNEFRNYFKLSHGSTLHNRKLFEEVGLFDPVFKISGDYELLLRKRMSALFMDDVVLYMQDGGVSAGYKGLFQTFKVKQYRKSNTTLVNLFFLVKGCFGHFCRHYFYILKNG